MNQPKEQPPVAWQEPLLDLIEALVAHKWVVIGIMLIGTALGIIRLLSMPPSYTASAVAVLLPREKAIIDASIDTSSLETTDDRASRGSAGSLMLPPNPTLYTTIINSRAVLTEIATKYNDRFDGEISNRDRSVEVIDRLRRMITTTATEEGMITVTVDSGDPQLSADIANELFSQCEKASKSIERQLLIRQAGHLDKALKISTDRLRVTEKQLSQFTSQIGLVNADLQASNQLRNLRELNAEKDRIEGDLDSLRTSYTENAPEVQALVARIATIGRQKINSQGSIIGSVGTKNFGELSVAYKSLEQKIRFERDMVATLATKSDIYRLRAEQPIGNLAIIRPASAPERPAGPSKKRELGLAMALSGILAFGYAVLLQQWHALRRNTQFSDRTDRIWKQLIPSFRISLKRHV